MMSRLRWLSTRTVVAALIIAVHVLLVIHFVPVVRIEVPAFVVTEVSLAIGAERDAVDSAPATGDR